MTKPIAVDPTHPRYREGERAARTLLDLRAFDLGMIRDLLLTVDLAASIGLMEDEDRYLRARGLGDALREYLQELGC